MCRDAFDQDCSGKLECEEFEELVAALHRKRDETTPSEDTGTSTHDVGGPNNVADGVENVDRTSDSDRLDVVDMEEGDPNDHVDHDDVQGVVRRKSDTTEDVAPEDCEEVRTATAAVPTRMHLEDGGQSAEYKERDDGPGRKAIGRGRGAQTKQATQLQVQVEGRGRGRGRGRLTRSQIRMSP
eukprot:SAG31_NODE_850_length_11521_cov_47.558396_2_plen_183_part_00